MTHREPDGSSTTTTTSDTETHTNTGTTTDATTDTKTASSTVTESYRPQWRVTGLVGVELHASPGLVYGAQVERRLAGPFWVGAWGHTGAAPVVGLSLGVEW